MKVSHLSKANPMYCANLALKVNAKLGGKNCSLVREALPILSKPTLIIGADITHPGSGSDEPSIAAVVGSMDATGFRYAATLSKQEKRLETITELKSMVVELLQQFKSQTKCSPQQIIFYRDGVSSGEFRRIIDTEVKAVKEACAELNVNYKPTLTYAAVQKRHHTRFFPTDPRNADRSGNVKAGTVVDSVITHPHEFGEFLYLLSFER
jgi:eukaryotic translation initiation factor 2C